MWLVRLLRSEYLPAIERALAGDSLATLGDPRFNPELYYLPDEPLLGFIEIPSGEFTMGNHERGKWGDERPQHQVFLPCYYLARWPVTVAQFAAFVKASGYQPYYPGSLQGAANRPVAFVIWDDALAYCRWLGEQLRVLAPMRLATAVPLADDERRFWEGLADGLLGIRLPSEAEWEKAARGKDGRLYPWGDMPDPDRANYKDTGINHTTTVGCFPQGASPWGCEEMSGNVWEWTCSLYENYPYPGESLKRQAREELSAKGGRVLRGGAFDDDLGSVRCTARYDFGPSHSYGTGGFRVVVSLANSEF